MKVTGNPGPLANVSKWSGVPQNMTERYLSFSLELEGIPGYSRVHFRPASPCPDKRIHLQLKSRNYEQSSRCNDLPCQVGRMRFLGTRTISNIGKVPPYFPSYTYFIVSIIPRLLL